MNKKITLNCDEGRVVTVTISGRRLRTILYRVGEIADDNKLVLKSILIENAKLGK